MAGSCVAALAIGFSISALLTTPYPQRLKPLVAERWLAVPLVLAPIALMAALAHARWPRRIVSGWTLASLLTLCNFCRGGLVLLIPIAEKRWHLAALSLVTGLGSGIAAALEHWIRGRTGRRLYAAELLLVAAGILLGAVLFGWTQGRVSYYSDAILFIGAALLCSRAGWIDG